jgi:hypothetical protein
LAPGGVFELLAGLVAKSLVVAQRDGATTRYRLLETIREFGEERLTEWGEIDRLRHSHAEYYCRLAALLDETLGGREKLETGRRFAAERDNLLAAVNHAVRTGDIDLALRFVRHSPPPGGFELGFGLYLPIQAIIELPGAASHDLYPYAIALAAAISATRGELERAELACREALETARRLSSEEERRQVEIVVAIARRDRTMALGSFHEAAGYSEHAARLVTALRLEASAAILLASAADAYTLAGDPEAGIDIARDALERARATNAPIPVAYCLTALAGAVADHEPLQARAMLEEALALRERLDIENVGEVTQATLIAARMGHWPLTLQLADRSIRHLQWGGQRPWLAGILNVVARALVSADVEAAARLLGAARHLVVHVAIARPVATADSGMTSPGKSTRFSMIADLRRQTSALLHEALDEGRLRQLRAEGEAMDSDQAAAYALEAIRRARQADPA